MRRAGFCEKPDEPSKISESTLSLVQCAVNKLELLCRVLESRKKANKNFAMPIDYKLMQILRFEWIFEALLLRFF